MSVRAPRRGKRSASFSISFDQARAELSSRLEGRRGEIEEAVLTRVFAVANPVEVANPSYAEGLRTAVAEALDYGIAIVELGEKRSPPVPATLLAQARVAARNGIKLDTVLRRYFAGYTLLGDFLIEEAEDGDLLHGPALKDLLRGQAALFDRLLAEVSEEHSRESHGPPDTTEERRAERVRRLLAGELVDMSELAYELDAWHTGILASGAGAVEAVRDLAKTLDGRSLVVSSDEGTASAWLGGRRPIEPTELERLAASSGPSQISLAIGEPAEGLAGWRLTHRQARAAFTVATRDSRQLIRYSDVALLASAMQDDLLATSLRRLFLAPLEKESDGGEISRKTLRAYFSAERNVSSAAAILGVSRRTVANRLQRIEARLDRSLGGALAEIEVALRLEDGD